MKARIFHGFWVAAALIAAVSAPVGAASPAPAVGDTFTYRLMNGYNGEVRGTLVYEVTQSGPGGVTYSVTPDKAAAGYAHTVVITPEGNWLRHLVETHGQKVDYKFASAYPAYQFPLEIGKTWSLRVKASAADDPRTRSVRVDGRVMGMERVRVPAGEFDAIRVRRFAYPGDEAFMLKETHIIETDWYVPALGRAVRTERNSLYLDMNSCGPIVRCEARGDWDIYELVESRTAKH